MSSQGEAARLKAAAKLALIIHNGLMAVLIGKAVTLALSPWQWIVFAAMAMLYFSLQAWMVAYWSQRFAVETKE